MKDISIPNPTYHLCSETKFHRAINDEEIYSYGRFKFLGNETNIFKSELIAKFRRVWFVDKDDNVVVAITEENIKYIFLDDEGKTFSDCMHKQELNVGLPEIGGVVYSKNPKIITDKNGKCYTRYQIHVRGWKFSDFKIL